MRSPHTTPPTAAPACLRNAFRILAVAAALTLGGASGAAAQSLPELFSALRQGGGWISIPVEAGEGTLRTSALPTAGLRVAGCLEIWAGHSGDWTVRIEDRYGNGKLEAEAAPAEDIPFTYRTGPWAQLDVNVRWSEPRDTTLLVWVGLEGAGGKERNACEPVYTGGR